MRKRHKKSAVSKKPTSSGAKELPLSNLKERTGEDAMLDDLGFAIVGGRETRPIFPAFPDLEEGTLPGWAGNISREEAEERLAGEKVHSCLLRAVDSVTETLVAELAQTNRTHIEAYVLTLVNTDERISEHLVLHTDRGWMFYPDDPILWGYPVFGSLEELLRGYALHPIY